MNLVGGRGEVEDGRLLSDQPVPQAAALGYKVHSPLLCIIAALSLNQSFCHSTAVAVRRRFLSLFRLLELGCSSLSLLFWIWIYFCGVSGSGVDGLEIWYRVAE
jgi:hypothetical protein